MIVATFPEKTMENSLTFHTTTCQALPGSTGDVHPVHSRAGLSSSDISILLYQQALALHQQNQFCEAETLYRQILDTEAVKLNTDVAYRESVSQKIMENCSRFFENEDSIRAWKRFFKEVTQTPILDDRDANIVTSNSAVPTERLVINERLSLPEKYSIPTSAAKPGFTASR